MSTHSTTEAKIDSQAHSLPVTVANTPPLPPSSAKAAELASILPTEQQSPIVKSNRVLFASLLPEKLDQDKRLTTLFQQLGKQEIINQAITWAQREQAQSALHIAEQDIQRVTKKIEDIQNEIQSNEESLQEIAKSENDNKAAVQTASREVDDLAQLLDEYPHKKVQDWQEFLESEPERWRTALEGRLRGDPNYAEYPPISALQQGLQEAEDRLAAFNPEKYALELLLKTALDFDIATNALVKAKLEYPIEVAKIKHENNETEAKYQSLREEEKEAKAALDTVKAAHQSLSHFLLDVPDQEEMLAILYQKLGEKETQAIKQAQCEQAQSAVRKREQDIQRATKKVEDIQGGIQRIEERLNELIKSKNENNEEKKLINSVAIVAIFERDLQSILARPADEYAKEKSYEDGIKDLNDSLSYHEEKMQNSISLNLSKEELDFHEKRIKESHDSIKEYEYLNYLRKINPQKFVETVIADYKKIIASNSLKIATYRNKAEKIEQEQIDLQRLKDEEKEAMADLDKAKVDHQFLIYLYEAVKET